MNENLDKVYEVFRKADCKRVNILDVLNGEIEVWVVPHGGPTLFIHRYNGDNGFEIYGQITTSNSMDLLAELQRIVS